MAISHLQNTNSLPTIDPQSILTDSLIGFVYEQIQAPDFSFGPYLNKATTTHNNAETIPTTQNNAETTTEPVGSYLNLAQITHNNAETTLESVGSCLNLAPTTHNNAETDLEPVRSCLNLAPTAHNNVETIHVSAGSYLNMLPAADNNAETMPDSVGSYLNLVPTTHNNAETESDPVRPFLNLGPTTTNNAEVDSYLKPVQTTHNSAGTNSESVDPEPTTYNNPAQVPTPNFIPITAPCISSQHQDPNCTSAQNSCHTKAGFTPSQFVQYHQACNNQCGTASLSNQVNILYQNTGFPVMPCIVNVQGMMVPAFKPETGFPVMPCTGQVQGNVMPAFKPASSQTVAARVRRKKISDKTQELAKLIPGGSRMNTAEMLLAAFKYVNFLQGQVRILSMMDSEEAREVPIMVKEYMHELLGSNNVQEYLSANGKCLVPIKLAMNWNKEMKSDNVVSRDLVRFVESINNQDNALS